MINTAEDSPEERQREAVGGGRNVYEKLAFKIVGGKKEKKKIFLIRDGPAATRATIFDHRVSPSDLAIRCYSNISYLEVPDQRIVLLRYASS